jgi:cytochrome P450
MPEPPLTSSLSPTESIFHPIRTLSDLQCTRPTAQLRTAGGRTGWVVTRYRDVRTVLVFRGSAAPTRRGRNCTTPS